MKIKLLVFLLFIGLAATSQNLDRVVGLRNGKGMNFTYQHFFTYSEDIKAFLSFRDRGIQITAVVEHYEPVLENFRDQFYVYYGAGLHAGVTKSDYSKYNSAWSDPVYSRTKPVFGIDAICGIEYRVQPVPLSFGIDYKPFFEFWGQRIFYMSMNDFALTIKYQF